MLKARGRVGNLDKCKRNRNRSSPKNQEGNWILPTQPLFYDHGEGMAYKISLGLKFIAVIKCTCPELLSLARYGFSATGPLSGTGCGFLKATHKCPELVLLHQ